MPIPSAHASRSCHPHIGPRPPTRPELEPASPGLTPVPCRGLGPSVAAILPEAAITYGLFDLLKRSYVVYSGGTEAGVLPSLAAGVLAAFTGQVVAYPLETVSRRMQVRLRNPPPPPSSTITISAGPGP